MNKRSFLIAAACLGLVVFLSACMDETPSLLPSPTPNTAPIALATATSDVLPATVTATPTYRVGIENFTDGKWNTFSVADRLAHGIPADQLKLEQAYVTANPGLGEGNGYSASINGSLNEPYKMYNIGVNRENVIAINYDKTSGNYELVIVIKSPNSDQIAIAHVIVDEKAQEAFLAGSPLSKPTTMMTNGTNLVELAKGNISRFNLPISMNSETNVTVGNKPDGTLLKNIPAFALSKKIVEKEGTDLHELFMFAAGGKPELIEQQVTTINSSQFVAPYAIKA